MEILVLYVVIITILGIYAMYNDKYEDMWRSAGFTGKSFTIFYILITLPGIIVYSFITFLFFIYNAIHDFLFPRKAGYTIKIPYDKDTYNTLRRNNIYFEHWGQMCLESSVIVFLCKKDYKKALKILPELQDKIIG